MPAVGSRLPIPPFTPEHEEFRVAVRRFVVRELHPHAAEWERERWFPSDVFARLAELGYLGLKFPAQYGGRGDPVADAVFVEELARCGSGGLAAGIGAHSGIALPPIWKFGTEEQKQRYLVPGIRGEKIAALAITEPDAGSDAPPCARTRVKSTAAGFSTAPRRSSPAACAPTSWSRRSGPHLKGSRMTWAARLQTRLEAERAPSTRGSRS